MSNGDYVRSAGQERSDQLVSELKEFLIPASDTVRHRGTIFAGFTQPVAECGGDWWTARSLPDGKILVLIADVMGHDVGSAIIMGVGKAVCDLTCAEGESVQCTDLLHIMNGSIFEAGSQGQVTMTCFVSVLDPDTRTMSFASAGHPPPLLVRHGPGGPKPVIVHSLGSPLGLDSHASYASRTLQLCEGDLLFWYTDGVTECRNAQGKRLSERRLVKLLGQAKDTDPVELRDQLVALLGDLHHSQPPDDDVTFVVARIG